MTNEICCSNSRSIFPSFMKKNALLEANNGVFIFLFLFPFIQIPFLHVCVCGFFYLLLFFFFWQRDHLVNVLIHLSFYTYISQNMIHEQMLANKRNLHHFCWRWWFFLNALKIWFAQMGSFSCMDPVFCLFFVCLCVSFLLSWTQSWGATMCHLHCDLEFLLCNGAVLCFCLHGGWKRPLY